MRDHPDTATSNGKHKMLTRDRRPFHRQDSNPQSHANKRAAADPHFHLLVVCTGRFVMFFVITNIYNKKTKAFTLIELFIATGKLKNIFDN